MEFGQTNGEFGQTMGSLVRQWGVRSAADQARSSDLYLLTTEPRIFRVLWKSETGFSDDFF